MRVNEGDEKMLMRMMEMKIITMLEPTLTEITFSALAAGDDAVQTFTAVSGEESITGTYSIVQQETTLGMADVLVLTPDDPDTDQGILH